MPKSKDFKKIYNRFISQFGKKDGESRYYAWLNKHGYDDTKPFPGKKKTEGKEKMCSVVGVEIKERGGNFHIEGLVASSHIDSAGLECDGVNDYIPKETLESFANQINSNEHSRIMGLHHSEGRPFGAEYFGVADIENSPARVVSLSDGQFGLYVDTKLLRDDPKTPEIIDEFHNGTLNSFSITYDTNNFETTDFDIVDGELVRIIGQDTKLFGYTAASNPVNKHAVATNFGFKEFKELTNHIQLNPKEVKQMEKKEENQNSESIQPSPKAEVSAPAEQPSSGDDVEMKEFAKYKAEKKEKEMKELMNATAEAAAKKVVEGIELKEKVLKEGAAAPKEVAMEVKEFREVVENPSSVELKEQFRRAAALCDRIGLDWKSSVTSLAENREFKSFGVNGSKLEYKGLGISTNQNTDTDYLQSSAELQDVYDPIIYNALNQETVFWNLLSKDDFSKKGNNQAQFTLKVAANTSAGFYSGNAVASGNVSRLKYQTKFKKLQVGVSVDGDMIAAARGGPVSDVFAQEVMDSTMDMLAVLNAALFDEVGLETADAIIGLEYITDSAGNTTLYNLTRSAANKLAPDSAGDTYINQASTVISMTNLRAAIRQARLEGANKNKLVFVTNHVQADLLRGKFDDQRRLMNTTDTKFGFSTDLFVDGVPVFEDKDCNTDDWFLVDLETHRVGMWVPPTIERLGKNADSQDAFIKTYLCTYNRAPRRMVQIYGCATA